MSNVTGTIRATAPGASTPKIYNVTATLADTEYNQVISSATKQLIIRCRGVASTKIAFNTGESGTTYLTIPNGSSLALDGLLFSGTLYFQVSKPAQVVEILEWT